MPKVAVSASQKAFGAVPERAHSSAVEHWALNLMVAGSSPAVPSCHFVDDPA